MQAYLRERLIEELMRLHNLANRFPDHSPAFLQDSLDWMKDLEQLLTRLRHPLGGLIASHRMQMEAAIEGHVEETRHSRRKAARFRIIDILAQVDEQLRGEVARIDARFDEWRDKIAQLAALASARSPIDLTQPLDNARLKAIWQQFGEQQEGANMHRYLSAVLNDNDLLYLLKDIIDNLLSHSS